MNINQCVTKIEEYLDSGDDDCLELTYGDCKIIVYGTHSASRCAGEVHLADNTKFDRWANSRSIMLEAYALKYEKSFRRILKAAIGIYA